MDILFFSKGKGWGHAVRDLLVIQQLRKQNLNLTIKIVSNGDGFIYLHDKCKDMVNVAVSELSVGEDSSRFIDEVMKEIESEKPQIIIIDELEEITDLLSNSPVPHIYITNYLSKRELRMKCPVLYAEKKDLAGQVRRKNITCVGPVFERKDGEGLVGERELCVLLGGSSLPMVQLENIWLLQHIFEAVLPEIGEITVYGAEYQRYFLNISKVRWEEKKSASLANIEDHKVVISRGGLMTLWELAYAGIPVISVPYSCNINPMELTYARVMAQRGLVKVCTYEEIDSLSYLYRFMSGTTMYERERMKELAHWIAGPDSSMIIANEIMKRL